MSKGWIGVDLDGTLFKYDGWKGHAYIGEPIMAMVNRVKQWIRDGYEVRIFTARASEEGPGRQETFDAIWAALAKIDIPHLMITNVKDYQMVEFWDDRAVRVEKNTGRRIL